MTCTGCRGIHPQIQVPASNIYDALHFVMYYI